MTQLEASSADRAGVATNLGPEIGGLLGNWTSDTGSLHISLWIDNHSSVIYKWQKAKLERVDIFDITYPRSRGSDPLFCGFLYVDG